VTGNALFPECAAVALKNSLIAKGGLASSEWEIGGNDVNATCP